METMITTKTVFVSLGWVTAGIIANQLLHVFELIGP